MNPMDQLLWKKIRRFYIEREDFKAEKLLFLKSGKVLRILGLDSKNRFRTNEGFKLAEVSMSSTILWCRKNV
jgi:hypothetical protein